MGGKEGALNIIQLKYPGESDWRTLTTKDLVQGVPDGTVYFQQAAGGGGWGDPRERPAEKVLRDVRNEMVSVRARAATTEWSIRPRDLDRRRGGD